MTSQGAGDIQTPRLWSANNIAQGEEPGLVEEGLTPCLGLEMNKIMVHSVLSVSKESIIKDGAASHAPPGAV